jgi:hypothetical protein
MTKYRTADKVRKSKKSYTLSSESVQFVEAVRKRRRTHSTSAVLEEILQTVRRSVQKRAVEERSRISTIPFLMKRPKSRVYGVSLHWVNSRVPLTGNENDFRFVAKFGSCNCTLTRPAKGSGLW